MNRQLARIHISYALAYYRRVLTQAMREATGPWASRLGTTAAIAALSFIASWSLTGSDALRLLYTLAGIVAFWLLVVVWFLVTIPPRIEFEMQQKEEVLRLMSERRGIANELGNLRVLAQTEAQKARGREIQAEGQGGSLAPPVAQAYHQQALDIANRAIEYIRRFEGKTGHVSYVDQMEEINGAVSTRRAARADEAIAQLEALAEVFDRQIRSKIYL